MNWRLHVTHRELSREGEVTRDGNGIAFVKDRPAARRDEIDNDPRDQRENALPSSIQAQEA